jgi:hypothetical protein
LVGNPEGKRLSRRHSLIWEHNIRMDLRDIEWEGVDWMHVGQVRDQWQTLLNTVIKLQVP